MTRAACSRWISSGTGRAFRSSCRPIRSAGHISHDYTDHVSILKFIEKNWGVAPVTQRSRDNLPNPRAEASNSYVPVNTPAIGDLFDLFDFQRR